MQITVLVGTVKGAFLLRSGRDRRDWTIEGPLFKGWKVTAAARDLGDGYLLATASDVYGPAIHRTRAFDAFEQVAQSPSYTEESGFSLKQIWRLARAGDRLFAGVDEAGLFASDDGGERWSEVESLTGMESRPSWFPGAGGLCAHSLLADPTDPARLWVGISAVGVFASDDGGESWAARNAGVPCIIEDEVHDIGYCVHALVADPADADVIWRMDHTGMFRTRDGGAGWERIENGLPSSFGFPLVIDGRTKTLYASMLESDEYRMPVDGALRVHRSRDGGDSWEPLTKGLPQEHAYTAVLRSAMSTDHLDPCGVYFGTTAGDVYVSADGGDSWRALPCRLPRVLTVEAFVEE